MPVSFVAMFLLVSCSTPPPTPPSPPAGVIGGIPAMQSKVVLRQQEVKMSANITDLLPAGEYRAAYGDPNGVYYEAPSKIIERQGIIGMRTPDLPFTGGIYLERANPTAAKIWEMSQDPVAGRRPGKLYSPEEQIGFKLTR